MDHRDPDGRPLRRRPGCRLLELADRQRDEDRQDDPHPDQRVGDRVRQRPDGRLRHGAGVPERLPDRLGDRRHRVPLCERLEGARQEIALDERVGHERHREDEHERRVLDHLHRPDLQPDPGHDPGDRVGEHQQQQEAPDGRERPGPDAPPHDQAGHGHDQDRDRVVDDVARGPAHQHRRAGHRQRPEPVDDALRHVVRQPDAREGRPEDHRLGEDPRDQVLAVAHARDVDRAAEHQPEQQHEHDRRHRGPHQDVRDALDLDQVAFGHHCTVGEDANNRTHRTASLTRSSLGRPWPSPDPSSAGGSSSATWPVSDRKTSSRVGRRSPMSAMCTLASAKRSRTRLRTSAPPLTTAAVSVRIPSSTWTSSWQSPPRITRAFWRSAASERTTSTRSPPTWAFSVSAVPWAITRPWSMTTMSSASRSASSMYCVVSSTVDPPWTSSWMVPHIWTRLRGSSPVVGSSRNRTSGLATSAAARSRRRRMPPEYVFVGRSPAYTRSNRSRSSRARSRDRCFPRWYRRPTMSRFSNPVRCSSTAAFCPESPMRSRTLSGSAHTSRPATTALPSSGSSSVVRMRTAVVFPAPFGPSSPSTVPCGTARSMPSSAVTLPYRLTSPSVRIVSFELNGPRLPERQPPSARRSGS